MSETSQNAGYGLAGTEQLAGVGMTQHVKRGPGKPAAVVSFRDDYTKWGRIEVSWWVESLSGLMGGVTIYFAYAQTIFRLSSPDELGEG